MTTNKKIRVAISLGDINGIGPEIVLKSLTNKDILEFFTPVIFGSIKVLNFHANTLEMKRINLHGIATANQALDNKINVVNLWKDLPEIDLGKSNPLAGQLAFESLQAASKSVKEGLTDVLVTAPINKKNIQSEEFKFPGHTEFLANNWGGNALMFMITPELKVGLVTQHIPVSEIPQNINKEEITNKIKVINQTLQQDFGIGKPKIAVLGLNPHAGDNNLLGTEDQELIKPAVNELFNKGLYCFGPYSADSFFLPKNLHNFDAVLAMYHDQGLIPFKTLSFGHGVNYTANLPWVRTSPDHGVAYEIAGKNLANHQSFSQAIYSAIDIYKQRLLHKELISNPLKSNTRKTYQSKKMLKE